MLQDRPDHRHAGVIVQRDGGATLQQKYTDAEAMLVCNAVVQYRVRLRRHCEIA